MKKKIALIIAAGAMVLAVAIPAGAAFAAKPPQNNTGLTAKIVATPGQHITGNIDASGFDIGIYVGPHVTGVVINGANVTGANDHGIFVQDTSGIVIENSNISHNAISAQTHAAYAGGPLAEDKAIVLAGTKDCVVVNDNVTANGAGGIGVYDDGPSANVTFALTAIDSTPVPSAGNIITWNTVSHNLNDCGIVVSAKNAGPGVSGNVVSHNTIDSILGGWTGTPYQSPPEVGGIIIAGGSYGPVKVMGTLVEDNSVNGGLVPGISIHGSGNAKIRGTQVISNDLSNNGAGEFSGNTTGVEIAGVPGVIIGTSVTSDTINGDAIGVYHVGDTGTTIENLMGDSTTIAP